MANARTFARSFNGGEVSPEFFGRVDDTKYQMGLALARNFMLLPHGPAANRPGTEFVRATKNNAVARLIPFTYSTEQTMVVEMGAGYFRFHTLGATLVDGIAPYEITNPYQASDLFQVKYVQSADVLTMVHPDHPVYELRRLGALSWSFLPVVFGSTTATPANLNVTPVTATSPTNLRDYLYVVTATIGQDESLPSPPDTANNNLDEAGAKNTITFDAVTGAAYYSVYRQEAGVYAFIGVTTTLTMIDEGITPDVTRTPPSDADPFDGTGNYPAAVTYYEQRRTFAAPLNGPQTLWFTRSGTESNMNTSVPVRDDDAITFRIAAREANTIRHLVPLQDLIVLTQAAEWRVGSSVDVLTPTTISIRPQSFVGSAHAAPLVVNNNLLFVSARGGHVRELGFSNDAGGYITNDLSLRASHLFDSFTIVDTAQSKSPYPICWFVSSMGELLGLTYIPEQSVSAWHRHSTTNGLFESVCAVAEGDEDFVYLVVNREINGSTVRYVERIASRRYTDLEDCFFVDAGARYEGPAISSVSSGLGHLEGQEVSILVNGGVHAPRTVTGGTVELDTSGTNIVIGLPLVATLKTLPFAAEMQGMGQGRAKNVNEVWIRVFESSSLFAGPSEDKLYENKVRTDEPMGSPPDRVTAEVNLKVAPSWSAGGELVIQQPNPLPLTVLSISMEVAIGG